MISIKIYLEPCVLFLHHQSIISFTTKSKTESAYTTRILQPKFIFEPCVLHYLQSFMPSTRRRQPNSGIRRCNAPANSHPHFFKFVDSVTVKKLKIPPKFVRKHGENLSKTIFLKVPNGGSSWRVETKKCENGEVWFGRGWQDFVDFYSIEFGDFLVFRFEGKSLFCVLIFDKTATEIEYPFKNENHGEEINIDDDDDDDDDELKVPKMVESENDDVSVEILEDFPSSQTRTERSHLQSKVEVHNVASKAEKLRALERAKGFKSENPFFIVTMQPSYVLTKCYLNMPVTFARKYFTEKRYNVLLRVSDDGKTWSTKFYHGVYNSRLNVGWKAFVHDNRLKVGDVCVFELLKEVQYSLKVVIFRTN